MENLKFFDNIDSVLVDPNLKDKPIVICLKTNEARLSKQYEIKEALSPAFSIIEMCVLASTQCNSQNNLHKIENG
jgi:hypothetical protein